MEVPFRYLSNNMKMTVNQHTIFILPTRLLVNRLTAGIIRKKMEREGLTLTTEQLLLFTKELKRYKKNHPQFCLMEATSPDGKTIRIFL